MLMVASVIIAARTERCDSSNHPSLLLLLLFLCSVHETTPTIVAAAEYHLGVRVMSRVMFTRGKQLLGVKVASYLSDAPEVTWAIFIFFSLLHVYANYRCVVR